MNYATTISSQSYDWSIFYIYISIYNPSSFKSFQMKFKVGDIVIDNSSDSDFYGDKGRVVFYPPNCDYQIKWLTGKSFYYGITRESGEGLVLESTFINQNLIKDLMGVK